MSDQMMMESTSPFMSLGENMGQNSVMGHLQKRDYASLRGVAAEMHCDGENE